MRISYVLRTVRVNSKKRLVFAARAQSEQLHWSVGFSQFTANGTSLVALLAPVGILGALQYYREGKIGPEHFKAGMLIAVGLFIGVYIGSRIAIGLPEAVLRRSFALFVGAIALKLWFFK